jgi:hypothetical protein
MIPRIRIFWQAHEKIILLAVCFLCVFLLGSLAGKISAADKAQPVVKIEKAQLDFSILKDISKDPSTQTASLPTSPVANPGTNCGPGKIQGNISSSGQIYHVPGGAYYGKIQPEACFDTEAQAQAAGFRKSKR